MGLVMVGGMGACVACVSGMSVGMRPVSLAGDALWRGWVKGDVLADRVEDFDMPFGVAPAVLAGHGVRSGRLLWRACVVFVCCGRPVVIPVIWWFMMVGVTHVIPPVSCIGSCNPVVSGYLLPCGKADSIGSVIPPSIGFGSSGR